MSLQWFKFWGGEYLGDTKIKRLSSSERSCLVTLLCYVSQSDDGIVRYVTEDILMMESGIDITSDEWDRTKGVLKKLEALKIVTVSNEEITVLNWLKRQETSLTNAERQARYRDKHKDSNEVVTDKRNKRNGRVDKSRVEEIRLDKIKKEKEEVETSSPTPANKIRDFFTDNTKQEQVTNMLVEKGIPKDKAEVELRKFVSYWTELNKSGTKQKWELQQTFELNKRLIKWFSNDRQFNKPKNERTRKVWK